MLIKPYHIFKCVYFTLLLPVITVWINLKIIYIRLLFSLISLLTLISIHLTTYSLFISHESFYIEILGRNELVFIKNFIIISILIRNLFLPSYFFYKSTAPDSSRV